jgi:tetratricopeptide (TPR) repeat protein
MAAEDTPPAAKLELAMLMKYMAGKAGEVERAAPFLEAAFAASEGSTDEEVLKYREYLEVSYVLLVEKDAPKALEMYRQKMPEGWEEDAEQLNRFAWWCFENRINLEEAQELALKGVELAETDSERANILDTAAEICNARGNCDEALEHIKRAIELDPDKEYFKEQLARFEKAAAEQKEG